MPWTDKYQPRFSLLFYLGGLVIVALVLAATVRLTNLGKQSDYVAKQSDRQLNNVKMSVINADSLMVRYVDNKKELDWKNLGQYFDNLRQVVVIKKVDSLIYWNNSDWPMGSEGMLTAGVPKLVSAKDGWFVGLKQVHEPFTILIFYKVQNSFPIHNSLLTSHLDGEFSLPTGVRLVELNTENQSVIKLKSFPVGIKIISHFVSRERLYFLLGLCALGYILLFLFFESVFNKINWGSSSFRKWIPVLATVILVVAVRYLNYLTGFPGILKNSFLFTETVGVIPCFKTLGDILLNMVILFLVAWKFRKVFYENGFLESFVAKSKAYVFLVVIFLIIFVLFFVTNNILTGYDNQFLLNSSFFSNYGVHDLIFFAFLSLIVFLFADGVAQLVKVSRAKFASVVFLMVIIGAGCAFVFPAELKILLVAWISFLLIVTISFFFSFNKNPYIYVIFLLLVLAISDAFLFNFAKEKVRNEHQDVTASLLSQRNDPYFEFLFRTISHQMRNDTTLQKMLASSTEGKEAVISQYIERTYFNGRFDSYTKQFTLCRPGQQLQIQPGNQIIPCNEYFGSLPGKVIQQRSDYKLSLITNNQENIYYLATFQFHDIGQNHENLNLYIEFFADFMPRGVGYPELLIDSHQKVLQLSGYSFSRYFDGKLQYKFGDFPYPIDFSYFKGQPINKFFYLENFKHIIIKIGTEGYLVISRPRTSLSMILLPFSALFLFFSFLVLLFIVMKYGRRVAKLFSYSFRARLQLVFFASVLAVFLVLSFISFYYFKENSKSEVNDYLREKSHSVLIAMQQKLEDYPSITKNDQPEIQDYLQKLSLLFFSDINLYNRSGMLIASSRPEIFDNGLQSQLINPGAYDHIRILNRLFYLSREHIGNLEFYSSYMPLTLMNGKDAGILNLPYFAGQGQIQKSGYQMLANLLSLFVITGILGLIIILYLSKIMTKPLVLLQEKINLVSIEKKNEKIIWEERDEIGQLIEAYNQMVEKLEQSAELLKYSERERAWGEMARQITHEIRNPLTPMKLNVQYLLKAYEQKDENFDKKLKNISQILIDQIEALNEVAGMFSDFSKSSLPKNEKADLIGAIRNSITLFKKSYQVSFKLISPEDGDLWVWASSKSLMRIFNNLTKNSVQAMEGKSDKRIEVEIIPEESYITVRFTDFGKGIAPENKRSIFQPYFTTKSTGTGLGLAIVKNMMKEMEGTVDFESQSGKGTTFYLKFKRV
ncbi:MAG: GHKL domain-containing protein [Bacteroidales bacterium]|nr:GHKL domain-containing protein [Bacteroidales bacterium]